MPPGYVKRREIFAQFKVLLAQLLHHKPQSNEQLWAFLAKLNDVSHSVARQLMERQFIKRHLIETTLYRNDI